MRRIHVVIVAVLGALALAVLPAWAGSGGRTELTSIGPGEQLVHGEASTFGVTLSRSGRLALFSANDNGLPGADSTRDIYLRDRRARRTRLVSLSTTGEPANASCSDDPAISGNGRFVVFICEATNLGGGAQGAFLRDLKRSTTVLVTRNSQGDPASGRVDRVALSAGGRYVAFTTDSDNLPGEAGSTDGYVRDRRTGKTSLYSRAPDGTPVGGNRNYFPSISDNGRYVTFQSDSDLLPGRDGTLDLYVRDRRRNRTILASRTSGGAPLRGNSFSSTGQLSADGRFLAFEAEANNLAGGVPGVFVRDLRRGTTRIVSKTVGGKPADGTSPVISASSRLVAYESEDDDLPGRDGTIDVLRYDRRTGRTILISRSSGGQAGDGDSFYASISRRGDVIAFTSRAINLSTANDDNISNSYVRLP